MTPRDQAITGHLATVVCGWKRYDHKYIKRPCYQDAHGIFERTCDSFDPIRDPRDCAIVMDAWLKVGGVDMNCDGRGAPWSVLAYSNGKRGMVVASERVAMQSEAVCRAIYAASGGKEGE
jgi:hypothetical protein